MFSQILDDPILVSARKAPFPRAYPIFALCNWSACSALAWFDGTRIHPNQLPDMTIEILKAMSIHEPVILWVRVSSASGGDRLAHLFIDLRTALAGQANKDFTVPGSIGDFLRRELLELGMRE